jgi:hypothetical protein
VPKQNSNHAQIAESARQESYKKLTPAQKLEEVGRLRLLAIALKRAGLKMAHPDWDEVVIEKAVKKIFLYAHT